MAMLIKLQRLPTLLVLALLAAARGAGGAGARPPGSSGISQFWTDDYKVFEQVYGKTSDKKIYGATLPPNIRYGSEISQTRLPEASEKKARYFDNYDQNSDIDAQIDDQTDQTGFGNRYKNQLTKQSVKNIINKNPKSLIKFMSTDFKPITPTNDPEAYAYLKLLEGLEKQNGFQEIGVGGFQQYGSYDNSNPEDTDAYKNIQDILAAHAANKGKKGNEQADDQVKYLTYGPQKGRNLSKKPKSPINIKSKPRCQSGRCRKRATTGYRVRTRPYLRRIKHKVVSY